MSKFVATSSSSMNTEKALAQLTSATNDVLPDVATSTDVE